MMQCQLQDSRANMELAKKCKKKIKNDGAKMSNLDKVEPGDVYERISLKVSKGTELLNSKQKIF